MKTTATMFIGGALSIVLVKLLMAFVFPLLGALIGFLMMMLKFALIAAVIYFLYTMLFKRKHEETEVEA